MMRPVGSEEDRAENLFAPESKSIQKMRAKLADQWSKSQSAETQLHATREKIERVYARKQGNRVPVEGKEMALFADGQGVKQPSPKVQAIMDELRRNFA